MSALIILVSLAGLIVAPVMAARIWHDEVSDSVSATTVVVAGLLLVAMAGWIAVDLFTGGSGHVSPWQNDPEEHPVAYAGFALTGTAVLLGALGLHASRRGRRQLGQRVQSLAVALTAPATALLGLVTITVIAGA